jgi:hypothetical protein
LKRLTRKYKLYLSIRSRYQLKHRKRDRFFRLNKIKSNNGYLQFLTNRANNIEKERAEPKSTVYTATPSKDFSILENTQNVIKFVHQLKLYARSRYNGYRINIELSNVAKIDSGAISLLLSTVKELSYYNIHVTGNIPNDGECKKIFVESGFLAHMKSLTNSFSTSLQSNLANKSLILTRGRDKTRNKEVGETIKQAVEMLTGKKEHYQPIFSIIQEINGNSIEHAYGTLKKEHWLLSINHDKANNKVIFSFADNGMGILKTIKRKLSQQFFEQLQLYNDSDILRGAFTKKYTSRHEYQINRNKGLPLLKKIQTENQEVKNLFVITNSVFLYVDSYKATTISKQFKGTFYYWELDLECIERWKARTTK